MINIDVKQFRKLVLIPALLEVSPEIPFSQVCVNLVLETIWHESQGLTYIAQNPTGPGTGFAQCEPPTFEWLLSVMKKKPVLWRKMEKISPLWPDLQVEELYWNLKLSVVFCRFRYAVVPAALPDDNLESRAQYWFKYYNASGVPERKEHFIKDAWALKKVLQ